MINSGAGIRAMKRGLLAVFLVFAISSASQAGPLGVDIEPFPVIAVGGINISYNVLTGAFAADGFAQTLDVGSGLTTINAPFRILATIDSSGRATNGNLTVGSVTTPLLSGVMNAGGFGYQAGTLEFLFGSLGGTYVSGGVYSASKPLDVMLSVSAFTGSFATSWSSSFNTAQIKEDPPPVPNPEPSVLLLMVTAGGGLFVKLRKRSS
jgi:hypothetical protein